MLCVVMLCVTMELVITKDVPYRLNLSRLLLLVALQGLKILCSAISKRESRIPQ